MKTVGEFKVDRKGNQVLELVPGVNITWSEDGQMTPPRDAPPCGFNNEFCTTSSPGENSDTREEYLVRSNACDTHKDKQML